MIIRELAKEVKQVVDLEIKRKFFNLWRHKAKSSTMLRRGFKQTRFRDHVEKFCYNRIVKVLLSYHGHRLSRDQANPSPAEIISFINSELDHLMNNLDSNLQDCVVQLELNKFGDVLDSDNSKAVEQLLYYVDKIVQE